MVVRREHTGAAAPTTITAGINSTVDNWTLTSGAGYPTGAVGPWVAVIDQGLSTEEKVLVTARSGNNLTGITRGYDGTTAQSHSILASFAHCFSAVEADEANALAFRAPAGTTTLADLTSPQTLTNKTLTAPTTTGVTDLTAATVKESRVSYGAGTTAVTATDRVIFATSAGATISFDATSAITNKRVTVNNFSTGNVTVSTTATFFFGGTSTSSFMLSPQDTAEVVWDGAEWLVLLTSNSALIRPWTPYTPTFTNVTSGAGNFAYKLIGKTGIVSFDFTAGTVTASATATYFSLPPGWTAVARRFSASAGYAAFPADALVAASDTKAQIVRADTFGPLSATDPLTNVIGTITLEIQ